MITILKTRLCLLLLPFLIVPFFAFAGCDGDSCPWDGDFSPWDGDCFVWEGSCERRPCFNGFRECGVQLKVSAFFPASRIMRQIYSNAIPSYDLEFTKRICNHWEPFFSIGYIGDTGRSDPFEDRTKLRLIPLSLGLNYVACLTPCLEGYIGAGIAYSFLKIDDDLPITPTLKDERVGAVLHSGFKYRLDCHWYLNFFADYLFQKFRFESVTDPVFIERADLNLSGAKLGLGIGVDY